MESILVPTDFSDFSEKAMDYAVMIACKTGSSVALVHAIVPHIPPGTNSYLYQKDVASQQLTSEKRLQMYADRYREEYRYEKNNQPIQLTTHLKEELAADAIVDWVKELNPYLVVMGTQGATGIDRLFFGSVTTAVMEKVSCPVLAIPDKASVRTFDKIVYASNFDPRDGEVIDLLMSFANYFDSDIECLHINTDVQKLKEAKNRMAVLEERYWFTSLKQLRFRIENGEGGFEKGLDEYLESHQTDLLVMLTHERNFIEGLFHRSQTKNMAFHSQTPLLVFKSPK